MGSRYWLGVVIEGADRIAQYSQFGAIPDEGGVEILSFLAARKRRQALQRKAARARFITDQEMAAISLKHNNWAVRYPWLSRECGAEILDWVVGAPDGIGLREWSRADSDVLYRYVIDFDRNLFEVFDTDIVGAIGSWSLDTLPREANFLAKVAHDNGEPDEPEPDPEPLTPEQERDRWLLAPEG